MEIPSSVEKTAWEELECSLNFFNTNSFQNQFYLSVADTCRYTCVETSSKRNQKACEVN